MAVTLSDEHALVLRRLIDTIEVQNLIGGEEWDLTDAEEGTLWEIIKGPYLRPSR